MIWKATINSFLHHKRTQAYLHCKRKVPGNSLEPALTLQVESFHLSGEQDKLSTLAWTTRRLTCLNRTFNPQECSISYPKILLIIRLKNHLGTSWQIPFKEQISTATPQEIHLNTKIISKVAEILLLMDNQAFSTPFHTDLIFQQATNWAESIINSIDGTKHNN